MKRKVAILGATGAVGQRFVQMLQDHPWFQIEVLAASGRSAEKKYKEACNWLSTSELSPKTGDISVVNADVASISKAGQIDLVFSALPADVAGPIEREFAKEYPVISKASTHRLEKDVPLIIPEVNPEHLALISIQKAKRGWNGFISTDPNCSTIQLALSLRPLMVFGLRKIVVSTMQALSGAGYPGVPSLDIIDNVIPFISKEEEKIENETLKILGTLNGEELRPADVIVSATCNRVNVKNGHLESVFVELAGKPTLEEVKEAFRRFKGEPQKLRLPSAPERPIVVRDTPNRPQPRYDLEEGNGMSVVVGRIRTDPVMTLKYMCLGHNTIRGAAGAGILSAELMASKGYL